MADDAETVAREVAGACRATIARKEARRLTRLYDHALAPHGLRSTEYAVLIATARLGDGLMGDVADLLGMEISTLSRSAASLSTKGWVDVVAESHKTRRMSLTPEGEAVVRAAYPAWQRAQAEAAPSS